MQKHVNLVDLVKRFPTNIFLQKSEPIQPKTSNILQKFCQPTLSGVTAAPRPGSEEAALATLADVDLVLDGFFFEDEVDRQVERFDVEPFPDFSPK